MRLYAEEWFIGSAPKSILKSPVDLALPLRLCGSPSTTRFTVTLSPGLKRAPTMTTEPTGKVTVAVGLHAAALTTRLTVTLVPAVPIARSVYGVQTVTFALGNVTVSRPVAVAVPRTLCLPALSVRVTRSRDLKPVPRTVNGFSFTTFRVAFVVAVEAVSVPVPRRPARSATTTTALPGVEDERRLTWPLLEGLDERNDRLGLCERDVADRRRHDSGRVALDDLRVGLHDRVDQVAVRGLDHLTGGQPDVAAGKPLPRRAA